MPINPPARQRVSSTSSQSNAEDLLNLGKLIDRFFLSIENCFLLCKKNLDEPTICSSNVIDPLQELFASSSLVTTDEHKTNKNFSTNSSNSTMTNEKILALFNSPQISPSTHQPVQQVSYPRCAQQTEFHSSANHQIPKLSPQFVPFANTRSNTSAAALISSMPMRPVTEYMPASSDTSWQ